MDSTWDRDDRVEVFIDENNGKTTTYEADDAAYEFERFSFGTGTGGAMGTGTAAEASASG